MTPEREAEIRAKFEKLEKLRDAVEKKEPLDWYCGYCRTVNGSADRHCANCGRKESNK